MRTSMYLLPSESIGPSWRSILGTIGPASRTGSIGIPIGLVLFAMFLALNYWSLGRDVPAARAHVREAFASGALQDRDYLAGNTDIGRHQYNDCLILWQAIDQRASIARLTVSPLNVPAADGERCSSLRRFAAGAPTAAPTYYHRYVHGHTMLARFLLPVLRVATIRNLYHTVLTGLVLAGIATALVGLAKRRKADQNLFWLIVFLAFSRWYGLETYGQSLGHGPADVIVIGYCLFLALNANGSGFGRRNAVLSAAIFGALTAIFEFLTGGIPLGIAVVIGGIPFAVDISDDSDPAAFVPAALVAFCAGAVAVLAAKIALVATVFGVDALSDSALQLRMRMGFDASRGETHDLGLPLMIKKLAKGIDGLAPGMHVMAGAIFIMSILIGTWAAIRILRRPAPPPLYRRTVSLLASNAAIFAMLGLFWQHTMIHAWFMERTLVWTIASGFALFAFACRNDMTGPSGSPPIEALHT